MTAAAAPGVLRLFLAGDVMLGRGIDQILAHPGDPTLHEDYVTSAQGYVKLAEKRSGPIPRSVAPGYVWGDLLADLARRQPDLRLINLETAVTTSDDFEAKGINYRMAPDNGPVLTAAAIDGCALANNHVLDWGTAGLTETLDTLDAAGIGRAGAGRDSGEASRPFVVETAGSQVLLVAFGCRSSGIPDHWAATDDRPGVALLPECDDDAVAALRAVTASRRPGDRLVVSVHWGGNWGYAVPERQRCLAHRLIDEAGADLIWGHSAHHPKAAEVHSGRLILYGCGDLLNDYEGISGNEEFRPELTLAWLVRLERDGSLAALEMLPYRVNRFRLCRAAVDEVAWLAARMDRECARFGGGVALTDEDTLLFRHEHRG